MKEYSIEEAVKFYSGEFRNAIDNGFTIAESHEIAISAMNDKFPETKEWGFNSRKEWGMIGNAKQKVIKQYKNISKVDVSEPVKIQTTGKTNYMQVYRNFCEAGFMPKYLEPLIGLKKQKQLTIYIGILKKEGFVFEETDFGWITVEKPNLEKIEKQKRIAELKKMIKNIEEELAGLE